MIKSKIFNDQIPLPATEARRSRVRQLAGQLRAIAALFALVALSLALTGSASAQDGRIIELSLQDALTLALKNNLTLKRRVRMQSSRVVREPFLRNAE